MNYYKSHEYRCECVSQADIRGFLVKILYSFVDHCEQSMTFVAKSS